jgi:molecular chaperone DnaK
MQGERPMAKDNRTVGKFILDGIPPAPRGVPQVEVSFDMDANGILNVTAKDKGTGKEQNIRIEASTGLSKEEIEKMKAEAAANADTDKAARESADKINSADTLIFQTEKQMKDYGDKIPEDKKGPIEEALTELKEAHKMQDLDKIDSAMEKMNTAWTAASQDIYAASQAAEAEGGAGATADATGNDSQSGEEEVTDVEFEEVEDK